MTRPRNIRPSLLLRAAALCVVVWLGWSSNAAAQVFAPMCDETGASAIAPLPVQAKAHGEIRPGPCSQFPLLEPVEGVPGDPEQPTVNLGSTQPLFIIEPTPDHLVRPAPLSRQLDPCRHSHRGAAYQAGVYRPPR